METDPVVYGSTPASLVNPPLVRAGDPHSTQGQVMIFPPISPEVRIFRNQGTWFEFLACRQVVYLTGTIERAIGLGRERADKQMYFSTEVEQNSINITSTVQRTGQVQTWWCTYGSTPALYIYSAIVSFKQETPIQTGVRSCV
jgi:hypothetical protein